MNTENGKDYIDVEEVKGPNQAVRYLRERFPKPKTDWIGPGLTIFGILIAVGFLFRQMQDGQAPRPSDPVAPQALSPALSPSPSPAPSPAQTPVTAGFSAQPSYPGQIPAQVASGAGSPDVLAGAVLEVRCDGCAANFRSGPSVNGQIIDAIRGGELVRLGTKQIEQDGVVWVQVSYRNQTGWVAAEFLKGVNNAAR